MTDPTDMNCKKCGAELRKGALFCHKCGTRIKNMHISRDEAGSYTTYRTLDPSDDFDKYFIRDEEPAYKKSKKYRVTGLAAAVAAVLILCFCNANALRRMVSRPVDYYRYVERENAEKNIELINGWYKAGRFGADNSNPVGSEETIGIRLSEDILTPASEALNLGDLTFLNDIGIHSEATVCNDIQTRNTAISLGGDKVLTLDTVKDRADKDLYLRIPELGDDYIKIAPEAVKDLSTLAGNFIPNMPKLNMDGAYDLGAVAGSLPDAVKANRIINRYTDLVFDNIEDVEISGREKLELGGVEQKCRIITVKPGLDRVGGIADILYDTLKTDADVKEIIVEKARLKGEDEEAAWDAFIDRLDAIEYVAGACPDAEMKVYVDTRGNIICREIDLHDDNGMKIRYGRTINSRRFGAQFYFYRDSDGFMINIEGGGKKAGENYSGDFTLDITDREPVIISLDSFDHKAFTDQKLIAHVSVRVGDITNALGINDPSVGFISDHLAVLSIDTPDIGEYDLLLKLSDEVTDPLIFTCSYRRTQGERISIPMDAIEVKKIADMKGYLKEADFERVKHNLAGAGVPESITQYIDYIESAVDYIDFVDLLL